MNVPGAVRAGLGKLPRRATLKKRTLAACAIAMATLAVVPRALADNGTWTTTASGGAWSIIGNWSAGAGPIADGTDSVADFSTLDLTADNTVHLDSSRTIGGLIFGDTAPSNNWILDDNSSSGANILTLAVTSGNPTPAITVNNRTATISAVIAGTQGMNINTLGGGVLVLRGANTFTGGLSVQQGTLQIATVGALGANIGVTLGSAGHAGTLQYTGGTASISTPFTLDSGSGVFRVDNAATNLTLSGMINATGNALGILDKEGPGTLTLSGNIKTGNYVGVGSGVLAITGTVSNLMQSGQPGQVYLGNGVGPDIGTATVTGGGVWNVSQEVIVNHGALNVTGGGHISDLNGRLGEGGPGTATVSGSGSVWTNSGVLYVGSGILGQGQGTLTINSGGLVTDSSAGIADGTTGGGVSSVVVSGIGTQWTNSYELFVGNHGGIGTLDINSGGVVSDQLGYVGRSDSAIGTVTVTGNGSAWNHSGSLYLGGTETAAGGTGSLTVTSGGHVEVADTIKLWNAGTLTIDGGSVTTRSLDHSVGNLNLLNGTLTINGGVYTEPATELYIGQGGGAFTLNLLNGATLSSVRGVLGEGGAGTANVSGGSHWTNSDIFYVGRNGAGSQGALNITSGGVVSSLHGVIGYSGPGTVNVSGNSSQWSMTGGLIVGQTNQGTSTLTIDSHGQVNDHDGWVGIYTGATGIVNVLGSDSQWNNSGNLYLGGNDPVDGGTAKLNITSGASVTAVTAYVASRPNSTATVTVSGGSSRWINSGEADIGYLGNGTLNINSGGAVSSYIGQVGLQNGSAGTVTIDGVGSNWTTSSYAVIGQSGIGTATVQNSGLLSTGGNIGIAGSPGSTGVLIVTGAGSRVNCGVSLQAGYYGNGIMNINSGGIVSDNTGTIAYYSGSTGTVTVDGTGSVWTSANDLTVGAYGNGTMTIQGGGKVSDTTAEISYYSPSSAGSVTVTGTGSAWTTSSNLTIGFLGSATLSILAGGSVSSQLGFIGYKSPSTGSATVSGSGSTWNNTSDLYVGINDNGTLNVQSGGAVSSSTGYVASVSGSTGNVTVAGQGSAWSNSGDLYVGQSGNGTLTIQSGGTVSSVNGYFGYNGGSVGNVTVTGIGSTWTSSSIDVGNNGSGTLTIQNGGTVFDVNGYAAGVVTVSGIGSRWVNSGILVNGGANGYPGTLNIQNGGGVSDYQGNIANGGGSIGSITVTGAGSAWNSASEIFVGNYGNGSLAVQNGGAVLSDGVLIGAQAGSTSSATIGSAGSTWTSGDMLVGVGGNGTLTIQGGAVVSSALGKVAYSTGSTGNVTVTGAGSSWSLSSGLYIGGSDVGAGGNGALTASNSGVVTVAGTTKIWNAGNLTINGGSVTIHSLDHTLGSLNFNDGTLTVQGGAYTQATGPLIIDGSTPSAIPQFQLTNHASTAGLSSVIVGLNNRGSLIVSGGTTASSTGTGFLGYSSGSSGAATVTGAGSAWMSTGDLYVGYSGIGTLTINSGAVVSNGFGVIGYPGGTGVVTVTGVGSTWTNSGNLTIGGGTGALNVFAGGQVSSSNAAIGAASNAAGTVNINGASSAWVTTGTLTMAGTSALSINGGFVQAGGFTTAGTTSATINLNGGVLQAPAWSGINNSAAVNFNGGTLRTTSPSLNYFGGGSSLPVKIYPGGATIDTAGNTILISQVLAAAANYGVDSLTISTYDTATVFSSPPALTFNGATGAAGYATLDADGHIVGAIVTNRGSFTSNPLVSVAGSIAEFSVTPTPNSGGGLIKVGVGTLKINNANNSFTGGVTINAGTLQLGSPGALNSTMPNAVLFASGSTGNLSLAGNSVTVSGLSTSATVGTPTVTNANGSAVATLTVNLANAGTTNTFAGALQDGSGGGTLGLIKDGAGTLNLYGTNTYTGATSVSGGTLSLGPASSLSTTAISVAGGAFLRPQPGNGSITAGGTLTLNAGSSLDMTDGGIGAFNLTGAGLTIIEANGSKPNLTFELGSGTKGTDKIAVTGNVSVQGAGIINIVAPLAPATITPGDYDLITSSGGFSGVGGNNFTLATTTISLSGEFYTFSLSNSTASKEILNVSVSATTPAVAYWNGAASSIWNTRSLIGVTNWRTDATGITDTHQIPGVTTDVFFSVTSGATNLVNSLGADLSINSLTFTSNSAATPIGGANTLTVAGGGITVQVGSPSQTINANVGIGALQTWTNNSSNPLTVGGIVSGANGLSTGGSGTIVLSGNNTFTGGVFINSGTLRTANSGALNSTAPNVVAFGPGSTGALTLGGYSLAVDGLKTDSTTAGSPVVQNASPTPATLAVNVPAASAFTYAGVLQDGSGSAALGLTKSGAGTLTLTGASVFSGPLLVTNSGNGALLLSGSISPGSLDNEGTLTLAGGTLAGSGLLLNNNVFIGYGAIGGSGGFTNQFAMNLSGGNLTLSNSGLNSNSGAGIITLSPTAGQSLQLSAPLTNSHIIELNSGRIAGSGMLTNSATGPGIIRGSGTIETPFTNAGTISADGATITITQPFTNASGASISLANGGVLTGGAINNLGGIHGTGSVFNSVTNNNSIATNGGSLTFNAIASNAGTIAVDLAGHSVIVNTGLSTNSGVISLSGGTFDNNGLPLNNTSTGIISGHGTLRTGGAGVDNNGTMIFAYGTTTVDGPVTNESSGAMEIDNDTLFNGLVVNKGGYFHVADSATSVPTALFAAGFTNYPGASFTTTGTKQLTVALKPSQKFTMSNSSSISVQDTSTLTLNVSPGAASIGSNVMATVASGATLELAGSVSNLSSGTAPSALPGAQPSAQPADAQFPDAHPSLLTAPFKTSLFNSGLIVISGINQIVGGIDGPGTTDIKPGAHLTVDHINQRSLIIEGTSGNNGVLTIDASDASGRSLADPSVSTGLVLTNSLIPTPLPLTSFNLSRLLAERTADFSAVRPVGLAAALRSPTAVPEPSSLVMAILAIGAALAASRVRRLLPE